MNPSILNRGFEHPSDGWYHIEPKGEHPNQAGKVIQVIDDPACQSIVSRFNGEAADGRLSHGREMLIDHEHFKHDAGKETIAYGWLQALEHRSDGIYGRVRWSATGQKAVDGGDYRFFSTEYEPADLERLNQGSTESLPGPVETSRVRPLRLAGLTLTNDPNNQGARPITNRQHDPGPNLPTGNEREKLFDGHPNSHGSRDAVTNKNNETNNKMKNIAFILAANLNRPSNFRWLTDNEMLYPPCSGRRCTHFAVHFVGRFFQIALPKLAWLSNV